MEQYYSNERNVQIVVALMKAHGIKKVIVSPGSTNVTFVGSIQIDPFFELYSCVDERSAAYMACGMAAESGEPVAISCTGATASRNYFSALTEAYYRKLPILVITSTQDISKVGNYIPQVIDRSQQPKDTCKLSQHLQIVKDEDDEWDVMLKANRAMLELFHRGAGPVHINLTTKYSKDFSVRNLPPVNVIRRHNVLDSLPDLPHCKIAIYVGSHLPWTESLLKAVDDFCERHHAVVFSDPTANYRGKYGVCYEYVAQQADNNNNSMDLLIHIGEVSDMAGIVRPSNVWRVSEDGELRDRYRKLRRVFEMPEEFFFKYYSEQSCAGADPDFLNSCRRREMEVNQRMPEFPFSHIWIAQRLSSELPESSVLHLGILSPLRSWGYFKVSPSIECYCNQGGFGIDGNMSALIGSSQVNKQKIHFIAVGDLSFFYDINSLGNRHIGSNIRILLVNNGLGEEFKLFKQLNIIYVNDVEKLIAAGGHFGKKSPYLVRHFAEDLGFEYIAASSKEQFEEAYKKFIYPEMTEHPIIFECFTDPDDENNALKAVYNTEYSLKADVKKKAKQLIGEEGVQIVRKMIGK